MLMLEDSTLREGEQSPGVAFSPQEKLEIARLLEGIGVHALEVGTPAMGGPEREAIDRLVQADLSVRLIGWNRGRRSDVEQSLDSGLRAVHIGLPSSDHHLGKKFHKSREWVVETMQELVAFAKANDAWVSVSAEDVARADIDFLVEYARATQEAGADRMRLSDTIGALRPATALKIFKRISEAVDLPLQAHMHNDLGLATANTLAAIEGGAEHVHVTVNGLGERAGIAPLDEILLSLRFHYEIDLGCRLERLRECADYVAAVSGRPIAANKPITGAGVFQHESGIHVEGVLKMPDTFEPFPPELVGAERSIVLGKHSGATAIQHVLAASGVDVDEDVLEQVTEAIRYESVRLKRSLTTEEGVRVYDSCRQKRLAAAVSNTAGRVTREDA